MSDRVLKFRAWWSNQKVMQYKPRQMLLDGVLEHSSEWVLMQYTGLNDKHGNPIYEGDIIQRPYVGIPMAVRWNTQQAAFDLTRKPDDLDATMIWWTSVAHTDYEILGNVYEHPGLLKVGEE